MTEAALWPASEAVGDSYDAIARTAAAAVEAERTILALYAPNTNEIVPIHWPSQASPNDEAPRLRFPLESFPSLAGVVRTGQPYVSNAPAPDGRDAPATARGDVHAILVVPICGRGRVLGLLCAVNKPGGFAAEDVRTLTALAAAASVTLENVRLYAEEQQRRILGDSLREVSYVLLATASQEDALARLLDHMWRVARYEAAVAVLLAGDRVRVAASRGGDLGREVPLASAEDLRRVMEDRRPLVLSDADALLSALGIQGSPGGTVAAPLLVEAGPLGALVVTFDAAHVAETRAVVGAFAEHAARFLDAAAMLRREREAGARAAAVGRITRIAATRHEPDSLLQGVAPELLVLSEADRAVLYLKHSVDAILVPATDAGTTPGEKERLQRPLELAADPLATLARTRRSLVYHSESASAATPLDLFPAQGTALLVPMLSRDEILGAVLLAWLGRRRTPDPTAIEFLEDVIQQVAVGVENARLFAALSQMASTDELTQLSNRRRFAEAFRLELARARRSGAPVALLMADVDHLKRVNDAFGHPAGDAAIRHVAAALKHGRREADLAARLGGEEFAVLLPSTDQAGAVRAAERIREHLAESSIPGLGTVTVSIGVATFPEDGLDEQTVLRTADARLYEAKTRGRNRVWSLPAGPKWEQSHRTL